MTSNVTRGDKLKAAGASMSTSAPVSNPNPNGSDADLAARIARLWPHRQHESNAFKALLCEFGAHRWQALNLAELCPERTIHHCFWCSKVRVDGVIYET